MRHFLPLVFVTLHFTAALAPVGQAQPAAETSEAPLRAAVFGLVHGHEEGFFKRNLHRPDLQIVGIAEPHL